MSCPHTVEELKNTFFGMIFPFYGFLLCSKDAEYSGEMLFLDFPSQSIKFNSGSKTTKTVLFREILSTERQENMFVLNKKDKKKCVFCLYMDQNDILTELLTYSIAFSKRRNMEFEAESVVSEKYLSENNNKTVYLSASLNKILSEYQILMNDCYLPRGSGVKGELKVDNKARIGFIGCSNIVCIK